MCPGQSPERQVVDVDLNESSSAAAASNMTIASADRPPFFVAPNDTGGEGVGPIGVLGPPGMNYPRALGEGGGVKNRLSDRLTEG